MIWVYKQHLFIVWWYVVRILTDSYAKLSLHHSRQPSRNGREAPAKSPNLPQAIVFFAGGQNLPQNTNSQKISRKIQILKKSSILFAEAIICWPQAEAKIRRTLDSNVNPSSAVVTQFKSGTPLVLSIWFMLYTFLIMNVLTERNVVLCIKMQTFFSQRVNINKCTNIYLIVKVVINIFTSLEYCQIVKNLDCHRVIERCQYRLFTFLWAWIQLTVHVELQTPNQKKM